ncbi:HNH endonuclease signature motif containing protein [Planosporangium flavigriseum]|uniref:HNH endonuclease signature motif containing protein n=1 Tax=Planosporangium flavigriseum TaxID=373681 RepID=UPI0030B8278D
MDGALASLDRGLEEGRAVPVYALAEAGLVDFLDGLQAHLQGVIELSLRVVREVDGRAVAAGQGAPNTAAWLRDRYRVKKETALRLVRLAAALERDLPVTADALADGDINVEQVDEIAKAVAVLPAEHRAAAEKRLVDDAATFGPQQLKILGNRILEVVAPDEAEARAREAMERAEERAFLGRDLRLSEVPGENRVRLSGWLDRESAAQVRAAIDPLSAPRPSAGEPDVRTPGQRRVDALVEVCRIALACGELPANGGDRPQVVVTVGIDTLRQQVGAATLDDGSSLSAAAARRLACDAALLPAVLGSAGQVLDVGREQRLIKGPLRRALVLRDRGCAFPGCDRPPRWTDGHHIVHWADGGTTSLDNAVLLCGYHHRQVHHSPWQIRINPADGLPEFIPPTYIDPEQKPQRNRYHRRQ